MIPTYVLQRWGAEGRGRRPEPRWPESEWEQQLEWNKCPPGELICWLRSR